MSEQAQTAADRFDRAYGDLTHMPDLTRTEARTIRVSAPIVGDVQTFTVQTLRRRDEGDSVFIEYHDRGGALRLVLPPTVADAIARQRDALTAKVRRRVGRESAAARKARGEVPAFLKFKPKRKTRRKPPTAGDAAQPSGAT